MDTDYGFFIDAERMYGLQILPSAIFEIGNQYIRSAVSLNP